MTQPQRGSARSEVDDLRNIVDRLDLLMGGGTSPGGPADARGGVERLVTEFAERIAELEEQVDELRILVNHLMTIATWQAKVTAQLVDDELGAEGDREPDPPEARPVAPGDAPDRGGAAVPAVERAADAAAPGRPADAPPPDDRPPGGEQRRGDAQRQHAGHSRRTSTLDEDIDDILGVDRGRRTARDNGPPDFGI